MVTDWLEFALKLAEGARKKVAEDRRRLEELRTIQRTPTPTKAPGR
jgi:hypothetical protein